jgi:hypothetical protein
MTRQSQFPGDDRQADVPLAAESRLNVELLRLEGGK